MIGSWCEQSFVDKIDEGRGTISRSQFCRDALAEKLDRMGIVVPIQEVYSPDRAGKGGPKPQPGVTYWKGRRKRKPSSSNQAMAGVKALGQVVKLGLKKQPGP